MGFIETPYRNVIDGVVDFNTPPVYLSAEEEEEKVIAQANAPLKEDGNFGSDLVKARDTGDFPVIEPSKLSLHGCCSKSDFLYFSIINSILRT